MQEAASGTTEIATNITGVSTAADSTTQALARPAPPSTSCPAWPATCASPSGGLPTDLRAPAHRGGLEQRQGKGQDGGSRPALFLADEKWSSSLNVQHVDMWLVKEW